MEKSEDGLFVKIRTDNFDKLTQRIEYLEKRSELLDSIEDDLIGIYSEVEEALDVLKKTKTDLTEKYKAMGGK